jgi:hypothetical protein
MYKNHLYVFSPVDVLGRPFGGSLDVIERLKWATKWYSRIIIFCPGQEEKIQRGKIIGMHVIVVYGRKRLNLLLAIFSSAAIAWKPIFCLSKRRLSDKNSTFLFEGFLSILMLPQIFTSSSLYTHRKIRVHNDESLFHLDRANSEPSRIFGWALRFEAVRLWLLERLFYRTANFNRCFISNAEAKRFKFKINDVVIPYLPSFSVIETNKTDFNNLRKIVTVANFGLADNRQAICGFLDNYLLQIQKRGFQLIIGGYGSEVLLQKYSGVSGVQILGALSTEQEFQLYSNALCYLVASNNRAGYKTRISTALANGLVPVLHGRGAEANAADAMLSIRSSQLVQMIDDKSLFNLSREINEGQYDQFVVAARSLYKNFLFN